MKGDAKGEAAAASAPRLSGPAVQHRRLRRSMIRCSAINLADSLPPGDLARVEKALRDSADLCAGSGRPQQPRGLPVPHAGEHLAPHPADLPEPPAAWQLPARRPRPPSWSATSSSTSTWLNARTARPNFADLNSPPVGTSVGNYHRSAGPDFQGGSGSAGRGSAGPMGRSDSRAMKAGVPSFVVITRAEWCGPAAPGPTCSGLCSPCQARSFRSHSRWVQVLSRLSAPA